MKNVFLLFIILGSTFCISPNVLAGDPLARMMMGDDTQDLLVLAEVTALNTDSSVSFNVLQTFPNSRIKNQGSIMVKNVQDFVYQSPSNLLSTLKVGKKYVVSLKQIENYFIPAWNMYEVTGTRFEEVKLVHIQNAEDAAFQIFINSGGTLSNSDFYFDREKGFLRTGSGSIQIYPSDPAITVPKVAPSSQPAFTIWRELLLGFLGVVVILLFLMLSRMRKKTSSPK